VKNSFRLLLIALLWTCSIAATNPLVAQSSVLEANRNLVSSGPPAPAPGARKPHRPPLEATAAIDFGGGAVVTVSSRQGGGFDLVALRHDQAVDISVQYAAASLGERIGVEALDGGQVIAAGNNLTVGPDGTIHFKFRAGHQPGAYQIVLRKGNKETALQFWVRDDEHPGNTPPAINSAN
jgi:hypothetical protein